MPTSATIDLVRRAKAFDPNLAEQGVREAIKGFGYPLFYHSGTVLAIQHANRSGLPTRSQAKSEFSTGASSLSNFRAVDTPVGLGVSFVVFQPARGITTATLLVPWKEAQLLQFDVMSDSQDAAIQELADLVTGLDNVGPKPPS